MNPITTEQREIKESKQKQATKTRAMKKERDP